MRRVFTNPELCIGCQQCSFACAQEHSQSQESAIAWLEEPTPVARIHVEAGSAFNSSFPVMCRHCDPAPCVEVCPTAALARDGSDLVQVDQSRCIACAMCALVCPFDAITFHVLAGAPAGRTTAVKCDGCRERVLEGREPACAEVCKVDALVYGEVNEMVAAGRLRQAGSVLAVVTKPGGSPPTGDGLVEGWRVWGEEAASLAAGGGLR